MINNDEARLRCTAAQVIDVEPKINQAIEESIRLLRHGVWASSVGAVGIVVPSITTPTISRILCDNILICFGFPKINPASVNNIMNKIIGWNLIRFLAQQVSQSVTLGSLVAGLTIVSLGGGAPIIGLMSLLEAPAAARMIIKCACDLILILDRAFKHGGKFVTSTDIELASREYVAKPSEKGRSKRKEVHARVMKLIPIVSKRFWNSVRISKIKVGMDEIIRSNRWEPSKAIVCVDSVGGSMVQKLSIESLRDEVETKEIFELGKEGNVEDQQSLQTSNSSTTLCSSRQ